MPELSRFFGIVIRMFYSDYETGALSCDLWRVRSADRNRNALGARNANALLWNGLRSIVLSFARTGDALAMGKREEIDSRLR